MPRQAEPELEPTERFARVSRQEWRGDEAEQGEDLVVREEPLEIRVEGRSLAVVMRTPGHDEELALGFLLTEGIIQSAADIASLRHCDTIQRPEEEDNVMLVTLSPGIEVDWPRLRRNFFASSSCGVCGKASIDRVLSENGTLHPSRAQGLGAAWFYELPKRLRSAQPIFDRTGGLHAAGLFTLEGHPEVVREDVGRHNAVDKIVGWSLAKGGETRDRVLMVSGRVSYEIVQKAAAAGIPALAAVSAPSSLAIELAQSVGMLLIGFLRDERMCVYAGELKKGG